MGLTNFKVRPVTENDIEFLWEMLYQAIYVPEGNTRPPRDILNQPDLARCLSDWGRNGDKALIAMDSDNNSIGAVWIRLFDEENKAYGYVDEKTPVLGIAIIPEYRGKGIGTLLLEEIIKESKFCGYRSLSLSVAPDNPALRLYKRQGFLKIGIEGTSWTMKLNF